MKKETTPEYTVLLYYHYAKIEDPESYAAEHKKVWDGLGIKGRILIAEEGINGTCEGLTENINKYVKLIHEDNRFSDMEFKTSPGTGEAFPKAKVRIRPEIITTRWGTELDPIKDRAEFIEPEELRSWYEQDKDDFVVVDMRNDYEVEGGRFKKTIHSGMHNFRDLKDTLPEIEHLKTGDKKIVAVCNGNIRCEKGSALLVKEGFKNVYHLRHGIHRYLKMYPGKDYEGTLYVFDNRLSMQFAGPEERGITGKCYICKNASENFVNCGLRSCNSKMIACEDCEHVAYCKDVCRQSSLEKVA